MLVNRNFHTCYISEALIGPIVSAAATAAGAGVSGSVSATANRRAYKWTKKMYDIQRANYLADREYNSPANQMARFKEAGLNPNLIYGQSNSESVMSSGMPMAQTDSSAHYISQGFSKLADTVNLYEKMKQDAKAREVMDAQISEAGARQSYYESLTNRTNTLNGLDTLKFNSFRTGNYFDNLVKNLVFRNVGLNLNNSFLQQTFENRVRTVASQLRHIDLMNEGLGYENILKRGIKRLSDFHIDSYWQGKMMQPSFQNRKLNYDIDLLEYRKKLYESQKELYDSRALFTDFKKKMLPLQMLIDLLKD